MLKTFIWGGNSVPESIAAQNRLWYALLESGVKRVWLEADAMGVIQFMKQVCAFGVGHTHLEPKIYSETGELTVHFPVELETNLTARS